MNLKIMSVTLGMCQTNCYFVYKEGNNKGIFIDPADNGKMLYEGLKNKGFEISAIFITHGHFDHITGADELRKLSGAKIYAPLEDKELLEDPIQNLSGNWAEPVTLSADEYFGDGKEYEIEGMKFKTILTPGHTKGSSCFYFEEDKQLFSGDTLFYESIGRTDFPTGSHSQLVRNLKEKLLTLPADVEVHSGHGPASDIGHEKDYNPFAG